MAIVNLQTDQPIQADGSPALVIASGAAAGKVLTSDASGNVTLQSPVTGFLSPTAKTTTYTAVANDYVIATSGTFTVTSPAHSNARIFGVFNKGSGVITVSAAAGSIFGALGSQAGTSTITIPMGGSVTLISDGTSWYVIERPAVYNTGNAAVVFSATTQSTVTVNHGLGVTPSRIFVAATDVGNAWFTCDTRGTTSFRMVMTLGASTSGTFHADWIAYA